MKKKTKAQIKTKIEMNLENIKKPILNINKYCNSI